MAEELERRAYAEFERLLDLDDAAVADALARLRDDDPALAARIERLLAADRRASALHPDAAWRPAAGAAALETGARVGPYELMQPLGRGGMGEVWLARREGGPAIALKLLHPHLAHPAFRARFDREGGILRGLDHAHVARLLDAGTASDGRPWLALEYVEGERIDRWCDARGLGVAARVRLFLQVCAAVAHAHARLVVHRDLKPSNILVGDDGQVKLLDFGIAKLLEDERDAATESELTRQGGRALTPEYAAPEQITGDAVTTATDVYALGVLLYALLGGRRPYGDPGATPEQLRRAALETEPDPLGQMRATQRTGDDSIEIARQRGTTARELRRTLRGDLETIVAKALKKAPEQRYPTVVGLADDLTRWLAGEPVLARPDSLAYRARKFAGRNKVAVIAAAAVLATLVAGVAAVLWQAGIAREQALHARSEARKATAVKDFLIGIFEQNSLANPDGASARRATAEQLLALGATRIRGELADAPEERAELLGTLGTLYSNLYMSEQALALLAERLAAQRVLAHGAATPQVATALVDLADAELGADHADAAVKMFGEALAACDATPECPPVDRARAHARRGYIELNRTSAEDPSAQDDFDAALAILERASPSRQRENLTADALNGLANKAHRRNDDVTAERHLRRAVTLDADAVVIAGMHQSLGDILRLRQRSAESEPELRRAVEMYRAFAGPDHPYTANAERSLASLLSAVGRRAEAEALAVEALRKSERFRGEDNLAFTAMVRHDLANIAFQRGELEEAARLYARNEALCRAADFADNNCAIWMTVYGRVLVAQGRLDDAARILAIAHAGVVKAYGEKNPRFATLLVSEGALMLARGDVPAAETGFRRVASDWPHVEGKFSTPAALATIGLVETLLAADRHAEALELAQAQLALVEAQQAGSVGPDVDAGTRLWLGIALTAAGSAAEARPQLTKAVAARESLDAPDSPWLARARTALAQCELALGHRDEAAKVAAIAASAQEKHDLLAESIRRPLRELRASLGQR